MADFEINEGRLNAHVMSQLDKFARSFVRQVAVEAKTLAPVRSGNLKGKISADPVRRVGPWRIETGVTSAAKYSAPVHEGARPHVIRARNAPVLSFFWPKVGRRVAFKSVNHPGNAPNPFLTKAVDVVTSSDPRIEL